MNFEDKQSISYDEFMEYVNCNRVEYQLKEITANDIWDIVAYTKVKTSGPSLYVVFKTNFIRVTRNYTQLEVSGMIKMLDEDYLNIKRHII